MGDRIGVQLMREIYLSSTKHPGQLSLAIPPWVGAMSTGQRAATNHRKQCDNSPTCQCYPCDVTDRLCTVQHEAASASAAAAAGLHVAGQCTWSADEVTGSGQYWTDVETLHTFTYTHHTH